RGGRFANDRAIHLARMDDAGGERSLRDADVLQLAVLVVEQHGVELLVMLAAQALLEVRVDVVTAAEGGSGDELLLAKALGDLERGDDLRRFDRTDPARAAELGDARGGEAAKAAPTALHQRARLFQCVGALGAGAQ